eukprot:7454531-Pyramimonas_sp.AAC.1
MRADGAWKEETSMEKQSGQSTNGQGAESSAAGPGASCTRDRHVRVRPLRGDVREGVLDGHGFQRRHARPVGRRGVLA